MSDAIATEEELSAFSDKLQAWGESLPEREQELLGSLVGRAVAHTQGEAEAEEPEVAGFSFTKPSSFTQFGDLSRIARSPLSPTSSSVVITW